MSIKRLLPTRWARILAWTAATVSWGTTAVAVAAGGAATDGLPVPEPVAQPDQSLLVSPDTATSTTAALPTRPDSGLVVLRFTPVEPPPPEVITRTVTVSGGGGGSAPAQSTPVVRSSGS